MAQGVEVKVIFTQAEYNRLLRATVESGKKLPRTFVINATNKAINEFLATEAPSAKDVVKAMAPESIDLSHLQSDAGPSAQPSAGSKE